MEREYGEGEVERLLGEAAWLRRLAARLVGEPGGADDVAQETLVAAYERRPAAREGLRPWLGAVARRLAGRRRRRAARLERRERVAARPEAVRSAADEAAERELRALVAEALVGLEEPYRSTLELRYFAGLSSAEIARREDVPPATVRSRLARGLERLRARLDDRFRDHGGREAWSAVLLAHLRDEAVVASASAGGAGAAAAKGALAMATGTKAAVCAAGLVAAGVWLAVARDGDEDATARAVAESTPERAEQAPVPRATDGVVAPAAESAASDRKLATSAEDGALELRILDAEGAAIPEADLVLYRGDAVLAHLRTGTAGAARVELDERRAPVEVLVRAPAHAPYAASLDPAAGAHEIRLPRGEVLAGRVLVDGEAPGELLELTLLTSVPWSGLESVPAGAWQALDDPAGGPTELRTPPESHGAFRFAGLPTGWRGSLRLPEELAWDPTQQGVLERDALEPAELELPGASDDAVLLATRLPVLRGRVVESATGRGVPGAHVRLDLFYEGFIESRSFETDEEGLFAHPVRRAALHGLHGGVDAAGFLTRSLRYEEPPAGHDLGDVALERARRVRFRAVDETGAPIEGAVGGIVEAGLAPERSDAGGVGCAWVPPDARTLAVGALGHRTVEVDLTDEDPIPVVLPADTLLDVRLRRAEPGDTSSVRVALVASDWPFRSEEPRLGDPLAVASGATAISMYSRDASRREIGFFVEDRLILSGLRPGFAFRLEEEGLGDEPLWRVEVPALAPGEHRELEIERPTLVEVVGRVVDPRGDPVVRAAVRLAASAMDRRTETDASGLFRFRVPPGDAALFAKAEGLGVDAAGVRATRDTEPVDLVLRPPRTLSVRVRNEAGAPVEAAVRAHALTHVRFAAASDTDEPGNYVLDGLPLVPLELEVRRAGRTTVRAIGPHQGECEVVLPNDGRVLVHAAAASLPPAQDLCFLLVPREREGDPTRRRSSVADLAAGPIELGPAPPGSYELRVRRDPHDEDAVDDFASERGRLLLGDVRILPGETTELSVEL